MTKSDDRLIEFVSDRVTCTLHLAYTQPKRISPKSFVVQNMRKLLSADVVLWVMASCSIIGSYYSFGGTYRLHIQSIKWADTFVRMFVTACKATGCHIADDTPPLQFGLFNQCY